MKRSLVLTLILLTILPLHLLSVPPGEYQVKAALIFNFLRFVELNKERIKDNNINLCSFEENKVNEEVKKLHGAVISGLTIRYQQIVKDGEIENCSVLIVNSRNENALKNLLEMAYQKKILTISDINGYGEKGVVINMYLSDNKVRFEINTDAAEKSGVKISSRLLTLAKIIKNIK
ncbi:MAG: YfiR family protein [Deltaproteobacteria bacterium]|nr:YfiR family protein [Deltaproteobacteria bacterium]